jgi:hypothetical protein
MRDLVMIFGNPRLHLGSPVFVTARREHKSLRTKILVMPTQQRPNRYAEHRRSGVSVDEIRSLPSLLFPHRPIFFLADRGWRGSIAKTLLYGHLTLLGCGDALRRNISPDEGFRIRYSGV